MDQASREQQPTIPRRKPHPGDIAPVPSPPNGDAAGIPVQTPMGAAGTRSRGKFTLPAPIIAAAWLARPVLAGITMSGRRLIGLSAVVGVVVLRIPLWFATFRDNDAASATTYSYGFGLLLFSAAVIALAMGVVRVWMYRTKTQRLAA
jgi:hypothetical protein